MKKQKKNILKKCYEIIWKRYKLLIPPKVLKRYIKVFLKKLNDEMEEYYDPFNQKEYLKWIEENKSNTHIKQFNYNPLISILIPVYNPKEEYLKECIKSVLNQSYQNYEICIVDDCSKIDIKSVLKEYDNSKIKIKYRKSNGGISTCTNDALKMSKGKYIALLDNDDVLDKNALYEIVNLLNKTEETDFIYTDEDKLDENGKRCDPFFKPDFSPDTLMSFNYICHFSVIRKSIIEKVGNFRKEYDGAQDYDLFLRIVEVTNKIKHISKVLYHWRKTNSSTATKLSNKNYAYLNGKKALENSLMRRKINAEVLTNNYGSYLIKYKNIKEPLITIIILTKDHSKDLKNCIDSIYNKTIYKNYEIIVINNNSNEKETKDLLAYYKKNHNNFITIQNNIPFNFSKLNNDAIKYANGDYVVLLNNDTKIVTKEWLNIMLGYAMQNHIGAVGAKLLYDDDMIQHAGVVLDGENIATHISTGQFVSSNGVYNNLIVPYNYSAVTAACLMINKKKYNEVNGLEENLKVAYNDVDFCLKLRNRGYYNVCLPQVILYHYESKSRGIDNTKEKIERFITEIDYMKKNWNCELKQDKFYNKNLSLKSWFKLEKKR